MGALNSGNSRWGSEWKGHFPEPHFEFLGVPHEVVRLSQYSGK